VRGEAHLQVCTEENAAKIQRGVGPSGRAGWSRPSACGVREQTLPFPAPGWQQLSGTCRREAGARNSSAPLPADAASRQSGTGLMRRRRLRWQPGTLHCCVLFSRCVAAAAARCSLIAWKISAQLSPDSRLFPLSPGFCTS